MNRNEINKAAATEFGEMALDELGLYTDMYGRVIDQQTEEMLQIKGKTLKFLPDDETRVDRGEMVFDPLNNQTLANTLFGYYIDNRYNESGDRYVSNYSTVATVEDKNKGILQVRGASGTMESNPYYMDSLKYMDMIKRMNGESDVNLSSYDREPAKKSKKR